MAFLGVNLRADRAAAIAFEQRNNVAWPSLYDPSSGLLLGFRDSLTAAAVPTSYVVDADGSTAVRLLDKQTAGTSSTLSPTCRTVCGTVRVGTAVRLHHRGVTAPLHGRWRLPHLLCIIVFGCDP